MTSFWLRVGAVLAVLGCAVGMASEAQAQAAPAGADADAAVRAQAKEQFQAGVSAYEAQRYDVALTHFQEAYRIKPHPVVRVNIANCYDRLGKPLLAIFHFERFLEESEANAPQRKEVTDALRALRGKISDVTLRIVPDGALVTIDNGERRKAPILEPIRLESGMHVIEVSASGYQTQKRDLVLEGGQASSVEITLERTDAPAPIVAAVPQPLPEPEPAAIPDPGEAAQSKPAEPAQAQDPEPVPVAEAPAEADQDRALLPPLGWVAAGASVAMLVGAVITGQLALSAESDFQESRDTATNIGGATPLERSAAYEDALSAADRADTLAAVSDVLLVAGIVGVGVTVYIAVDHHGSGEGDSPSATLMVAPGRLSLSGKF